MIIPENRFRAHSNYYHKPSKKRWLLILILICIAGGGALLYLVLKEPVNSSKSKEPAAVQKTYEQLWQKGDYKKLAEKCDQKIALKPFDPKALVYGGFSYFYLAVGQFTMEEKIPLLNKSIFYLRQVLLLHPIPLQSKVDYILGKAYYNKGRYYLDLSIEYLKKSIDAGFIQDDSYKYLGMAYGELGMYKNAIGYFLKALAKKPDDMLYLVLGQTYYKMEDSSTSERYLNEALNNTHDFSIEQKSRFLLGKIFLDKNELIKAEDQYNKILEKNRNSADAHYYLGEIYSKLHKKVKARAEWRKALEIDPSHYGALLRLY